MDYVTQRRQAVARDLKTDGVDAVLITNPVNVTYLTGFTGSSGYLVLTPKATILVSDGRYEEQIREECPGLDVHIRPHDKTTPEAAGEVLTKAGAKSVGFESHHVTFALAEALKAAAPKATFAPLPGRVEALRAVKDPSEHQFIREAIQVAEKSFNMFKVLIRETDTEKDMADSLDHYLRRSGARRAAFDIIVAVGDRGALPHAVPTTRQLGDGSKLLVDWGADLGYKSDITRTLRSPYGSAPTRRNKNERSMYEFEELHAIVCQAQDAAAAACRHGALAKDVDAAARKVFANARLRANKSQDPGLNAFFTHGLGHGLGLEIHEAPRIRANSDDVLQAGMVITLEPGLYIPEWGGVRVEDDFLVTKDGVIRLTTLPRDATAIG
jgi:Xaa-Pro aminopeptidase